MKTDEIFHAENSGQDNQPTLLLVDDDRSFNLALSAALRRRNFRVVVAHGVQEGFDEAQAWSPSHAVIDLRLADGNGLDLAERLVALFPELKVVILTGYGSIRTAVDAMKVGAIQYLTKPVSPEAVIHAFAGNSPDDTQVLSLEEVEREHLQRTLDECGGNISEAARRLNMHRRTLQRKLAKQRDGSDLI